MPMEGDIVPTMVPIIFRQNAKAAFTIKEDDLGIKILTNC